MGSDLMNSTLELDGIALLQTGLDLSTAGSPAARVLPSQASSLLSAISAAAQGGSQREAVLTWSVTFPAGTCAILALLGLYMAVQVARAPLSPRPLAKPCKSQYSWPLVVARLVTAATTFTEGYDLVVMSGALAPCVKDLHLNGTQSAWVMGVLGFGMAIGAPIGGWLADGVGRVTTLMAGYCLMLMGPLLMAWSDSFMPFMLGRVVQALGMGASLSVATAYTAEIAPVAIRGQLPSLEELFIVVGTMASYLGNYTLVDLQGGWRLMLALGATLPALALPVLLLGMLPESPRYLMMHGHWEEAQAVLSTLVDSEEAEEIVQQCSGELGAKRVATWAETLWPEDRLIRKALWLGVGVMSLQMVCGANLLSSYMATVLAEEEGARASHLSMLLVAVSRIFLCIPAVFLCDRVGRRPLMLMAMTGTFIATSLLAIFYLEEASVFPWKFMAVLLFYQAFSPGLGCVAYVYMGEVMHNSVRSKGVSVAIFTARVLASLMVLGFPAVRHHCGEGPTFCILACINLAGLIALFLYAPETMGVPLESISRCFDDTPKDT